jgi:hypothetical protein
MKLYSTEHDGGLRALGLLDDQASWDLRHQGLMDNDGNVIPVPPFPVKPTRPIRPIAPNALQMQIFMYDMAVYQKFLDAASKLDNALLASLGQSRVDEIKSTTTGMANVTPLMALVFFRARYGVLTMAKLSQMKDKLRSLYNRNAQAYFADSTRVHEVLAHNGQVLNELEKMENVALAMSYDDRLNGFLTLYQTKHLTMQSRSYAAMAAYILQHDASSTQPPAANSTRTKYPTAAAARASKDDDDDDDDGYDHDDDEAYFQEQAYQDGYASGMATAHSATRSKFFGPNLERQMASFEAKLELLTEAVSKLTPAQKFYCFLHGSRSRHPGMTCTDMLKDSNYTLQMRQATSTCVLLATDGKSITGAK